MTRQEVIMIDSYTFADYVSSNYLTLLILASLIILLIVNHGARITGLRHIRSIIGIVFTLTLLEALERACDAYQWNYRILYFKTTLSYCLYPLIALLELRLVAPIKRKFLITLPYLINCVLACINLFDIRVIYMFEDNHSYHGGLMPHFPKFVLAFYITLLGFYSVSFISKGHRTRGVIALFMTVTSVITVVGEVVGFSWGFAEFVTARYPLCNIVFLTGFSEYMPSAFEMHASGYVLKPFSQKKIEEVLQHRRYRFPDLSDRPVRVQCFGSFEVFVNGEAVRFKRSKSKELLAYLIDRKGIVFDGHADRHSVSGKSRNGFGEIQDPGLYCRSHQYIQSAWTG